ncbi:flavocytochrome c [Chloroflexota bacterium]
MKAGSDDYAALRGEETDVVVVGAGAAGLAAAVAASTAGAETIILEKQNKLSDTSTALSGGTLAFAGTEYQESRGIQDSNELLYKDIMDIGQWQNDTELVRVYVANQLDTYHWLTGLGVRWAELQAVAGHSVPRAHFTDPLKLLYILKEAVTKLGVTVLSQVSVTGLITDGTKRVTGVIVRERSGNERIKVRRGVVLATGGFGRDPERLRSIDPRYPGVAAYVGKGHTGDGHRMAEELGAIFKDMKFVKPTFGFHVNSTSVAELLLLFYCGAIIVNRRGERFVNESLSYKDIGASALQQPDYIGFQIFDQKVYELAVQNAKIIEETISAAGHGMALDGTRINLLAKADTVEGLASQIGVPIQILKETVSKYNGYVDLGKDPDFSREALTRGWGTVTRIDIPPFYAYESKPGFAATYGGLAVDKDMHVLTVHGKIPGLYAAGELIGGFHGASYITGSSIGKSIIFGRIAGRNTAQCR